MRTPCVICSRPSSSFSRPAMIFSIDDLPAPLRPIRPRRSPVSSENAALSSRATWPKARWALERESTAMGSRAAGSLHATGSRENADYPRDSARECGLQRIDEHLRHVEPALLRDFLEPGRAGHIDLGQAVADHIQADEQQAALREHRADGLGDLAVARRERLRDTLAADRE